jgi:hypothetical protein
MKGLPLLRPRTDQSASCRLRGHTALVRAAGEWEFSSRPTATCRIDPGTSQIQVADGRYPSVVFFRALTLRDWGSEEVRPPRTGILSFVIFHHRTEIPNRFAVSGPCPQEGVHRQPADDPRRRLKPSVADGETLSHYAGSVELMTFKHAESGYGGWCAFEAMERPPCENPLPGLRYPPAIRRR